MIDLSQATAAFFNNMSEELFTVVAKQLLKTLTT